MSWLIFSLLAAGSESIKDTFGKIGSTKTDEYTSSFSLHLFSLIVLIPFVIYVGIPEIKPSFWLGSAAFLIITPLWSILYMKALRMSELSSVIPLMAFNPLFTGLLSFVFSDAAPSALGWLGMLLICLGIYVANIKEKLLKTNIFSPLKNIISEPGALAMLGVAFLWSLGAHFSKMKVDGSSPLFSTFSGGLIGIVTTYIMALFMQKRIMFSTIFKQKWSLMPVGMSYLLATIFSSFALQSGSAAYVFAVKRSSLAVSLVTGKFVFREIITNVKVIGMLGICGGIALLAMG